MKWTFGSVGALALALAWTAAAAGAATQTYEGEITADAKAAVEMGVEMKHRRRVVTEFVIRKFPLECEDGTAARLDRARLSGRARVTRKGRFEFGASNAGQRLRVKGRIGAGGRAGGTITYSGLTEFADRTLRCHANDLRWRATR
jgi:hypothetical protein